MKRTPDAVWRKWSSLTCAINEIKSPRTGQNQPLFKDSKALSDLRETVQRKSQGPLGVFNEEIMEAVMEGNQMHGKQAATIVKLALGMADYTPAAGSVKAVSEAVKASAEGRAPTSDLIQARRAGKNKRTAQPSMAEAIKHHAERQAAQTDRMELLRQQRDAERDYQRRLQAWGTECSRVRSTAAAADRDAVLKHTSIAMDKSNGDMQHYRSWMEVLTRTWEQHKPQLDLPPKPEPLPQLPQRLGPNSSQRAQLGREEAPAEEDSDNDSQGVNVHRGLDYGLS
ncbi:hypothetical protein V8C86DRAFT_2583688 [Haematococcus lacustris]